MTSRRTFVFVALAGLAVVSTHTSWEGQAEAQSQPSVVKMRHESLAVDRENAFSVIENVAFNAKPDAIVFAQSINHQKHIGVLYESNMRRWAVFNEDRSAMPPGTKFNIVADASGFVHRATAADITSNWTYIDNPATNGKVLSVVFVTQRRNENGANSGYNNRGVGVWYDESKAKWAIFNEDKAAMGVGLEFNVKVFPAPSTSPSIASFATSRLNPKMPLAAIPERLTNGIFLMSHVYKTNAEVYYTSPWTVTPSTPGSSTWELRGTPQIPTSVVFNIAAY